jgi:LysM repeat protein
MQQMKQPSPLVPQGSFEALGQRKSHVRVAVYTILAIHVVVLSGLLILGCKRDDKDTAGNPPTNDVAVVEQFTNADPVAASPPSPVPEAAPTNVGITAVPSNPAPLIPVPPANNTVADTVLTEHTIVKGDTFDTMARKYAVTVRAIQAANPNLQPTRLKPGDKVKIPAKTTAVARNGAGMTGTTDSADTYTVKSGDNLSSIAKTHHTTVKELQKLNNLTTTQIKVGQHLKLPHASVGAPASGSTAAPPPAPVP